MFQSLFSWMFRSKIYAVIDPVEGFEFQSLFSWMFRSKTGCTSAGIILTLGFNPCSRGCFARRSWSESIVPILVLMMFSILVLRGCFCSKSLHRSDHRSTCPGFFVSILVLVDVSLEGWSSDRLGRSATGFNPCSRGCFARSIASGHCIGIDLSFNPCSRGCFARSIIRNPSRIPNFDPVSILVLVDVSLEEKIGQWLSRIH